MSEHRIPGRLPSFKPPRDLTLSNVTGTGVLPVLPRTRKNYVPNIPPKRGRNLNEGSPNVSSATPSTSGAGQSSSSSASQSGGRGRGRGVAAALNVSKGKKIQAIQSPSVFGEGVGAPVAHPKRHAAPTIRGGKGRVTFASSPSVSNPTLKEEPAKATTLLGEELDMGADDFIEDLEKGPISKQLLSTSFPFSHYMDGSLGSDPAVHSKPLTESRSGSPPSFSTIYHNAPKDDKLILLQLPNQLPVLDHIAEAGSSKAIKLAKDVGVMPEGAIGKIQIRASGKASLVIGETSFDLEPGLFAAYRQELASIDTEQGKMTVLGNVRHKIICVPDLGSLSLSMDK